MLIGRKLRVTVKRLISCDFACKLTSDSCIPSTHVILYFMLNFTLCVFSFTLLVDGQNPVKSELYTSVFPLQKERR